MQPEITPPGIAPIPGIAATVTDNGSNPPLPRESVGATAPLIFQSPQAYTVGFIRQIDPGVYPPRKSLTSLSLTHTHRPVTTLTPKSTTRQY
jgi:hypothetical protein